MKLLFLAFFLTLMNFNNCELTFTPAFQDISVVVPLDMDYLDSELYVTSIAGTVVNFAETDSTSGVFFDITSSTSTGVSFYTSIYEGGQDGLTSIEFHPAYPSIPKFYAYHSGSPTSIQVTAWTVGESGVDYSTGEVLLEFAKVNTFVETRVGGDMHFDSHGNLYISVGDSSNTTAPQDIHNYLGKILRIAPHSYSTGYSIPAGNPYAHIDGLDEIFAIGFRNPRKILVDSSLGSAVVVGENGENQDSIQPINGHDNAGWAYLDGCNYFVSNPPHLNFKFPAFYFTGEIVGNPSSLCMGPVFPHLSHKNEFSVLQGTLLFADLYSGQLFSLARHVLSDTCSYATETLIAQQEGAFISSILVTPEGNVYISDAFAAFYGGPTFYQLVSV